MAVNVVAANNANAMSGDKNDLLNGLSPCIMVSINRHAERWGEVADTNWFAGMLANSSPKDKQN